MANFKQDDLQPGATRFSQTGAQCAQCEAALADVLDLTLTAEEEAQFDLHVSTCEACGQMLADAKRGAAWLEMLRTPRPEPPAALLERILAQTIGARGGNATSMAEGLSMPDHADGDVSAVEGPPIRVAAVLPFRSRMTAAFQRRHLGQTLGHAMLQPRLAMTAAMAFFSIGLTLNLTGVRLNEFRLANLKPANLRRSLYQADAHIVRYYTNLRVVYELESRVRDLQRATEGDTSIPSEKKPDEEPKDAPGPKQTGPRPGAGTSRHQGLGGVRDVRTLAVVHSAPSGHSFTNVAQEGESV